MKNLNRMLPRLPVLLLCLVCGPLHAQDVTAPQNRDLLNGFTYTQDRLFVSHSQGSQVANIHIYGWGALWPFSEGQAGEYDSGSSIEQRIRQATADGQQVVLTCATAPSIYRASGRPWNMEERVKDDMEDRYATRCAEAVQRWPQIGRVQVWNEFKGYWDTKNNRWGYENYTRFYNKVYAAVKAVRHNVLVGGGYIVLTPRFPGYAKDYNGVFVEPRSMAALQYWITHAHGYDAVCLDGKFAPEDFLKLSAFFRQLTGGRPVWWSEYYGRNGVDDMRAARMLFAKDHHPGDMALWWDATALPW
jgi:hypothetical protein